jgi:hypothetical protein
MDGKPFYSKIWAYWTHFLNTLTRFVNFPRLGLLCCICNIYIPDSKFLVDPFGRMFTIWNKISHKKKSELSENNNNNNNNNNFRFLLWEILFQIVDFVSLFFCCTRFHIFANFGQFLSQIWWFFAKSNANVLREFRIDLLNSPNFYTWSKYR